MICWRTAVAEDLDLFAFFGHDKGMRNVCLLYFISKGVVHSGAFGSQHVALFVYYVLG